MTNRTVRGKGGGRGGVRGDLGHVFSLSRSLLSQLPNASGCVHTKTAAVNCFPCRSFHSQSTPLSASISYQSAVEA